MWLGDILEKIKRFFRGESYSVSANEPLKKKFKIHNTAKTKGKFRIISERKVQVKKNGKINILNESRPRNCPRCRSSNTISKSLKANKWECDVDKGGCGYKW